MKYGLQEQIAVTGVGVLTFPPRAAERPLEELIFDAVGIALCDAGIEIAAVDSVFMASSDLADGRVISCMTTEGAAGSYYRDMTNISSSAEHALIAACLKIYAGLAECCVVVSWGKSSSAPFDQIDPLSLDYLYLRPFGLNRVSAAALCATSYLAEHPVAETVLADIVCRNRLNGVRNPHAQIRRSVDPRRVLSSPFLVWPLRKDFVATESDGACALVLQSRRQIEKSASALAWIAGFGWATDSYWKGGKELSYSESAAYAAEKAFRMAGISDPKRDVDVAELEAFSAYDELISYEELGLCEKRRSVEFAEQLCAGVKAVKVNPSGGLLCSNPSFAANLVRVAEAAWQVMGKAGERQVPGAHTALAQCVTGLFRQSCSVFVFRAA